MHFLVVLLQAGLCFFHTFIPSWGLSIILFTSAIRILFFPLQVFGIKQQRKLQKLKPEIEALQNKFKNDSVTLVSERRRLMKRARVSPIWIFVASAIQLPIFISMYKVIRLNESLSLVHFAWLSNLAVPDPFMILPSLVAIVLWYQLRSSPKATTGAIGYVMPAISFAFMVSLPSAIVLYSLTGNVLQFLGQKVVDAYC